MEVNLSAPRKDKNAFRTLDRLFWLFWIFWTVLLLVLGVVLWFVFDPTIATKGFSTSDLACFANVSLPASLSTLGKFIYGALISLSFIFYSFCFAILHRAIRSFRAGHVFDDRLLKSLTGLGIALVVFPFVQCLLEIGVLDFLERHEGAKLTTTGSVIDVGTMAFGLFVLALRHVLQHGLVIKTENDLTI